mmetsp:Transcript_36875/g.95499  ORF Transcript_36875/g.95499 Transcript_36875/m.95499 type:complete len:135 (-) Transcript_36875:1799-2203(-)
MVDVSILTDGVLPLYQYYAMASSSSIFPSEVYSLQKLPDGRALTNTSNLGHAFLKYKLRSGPSMGVLERSVRMSEAEYANGVARVYEEYCVAAEQEGSSEHDEDGLHRGSSTASLSLLPHYAAFTKKSLNLARH